MLGSEAFLLAAAW